MIVHIISGKCMEAVMQENNKDLYLRECDGKASQLWQFDNVSTVDERWTLPSEGTQMCGHRSSTPGNCSSTCLSWSRPFTRVQWQKQRCELHEWIRKVFSSCPLFHSPLSVLDKNYGPIVSLPSSLVRDHSMVQKILVFFPSLLSSLQFLLSLTKERRVFSGGSAVKDPPAKAGEVGSVPGLGWSPGEWNSNPLQYSCLENSMDRGAWQAVVHGVIKSWTQLSN